ncbi:MAG: pyrroline-5-carboxylate reductase [Bdellovibrionales bacterium]|nr:pyrroline-5-carboxylate reductase [Bdellovibrionales bacterium]
MTRSIAIIGCGNLGATLARAYLRADLVDSSSLFLVERDPQKRKKLSDRFGCHVLEKPLSTLAGCETVVVAVKPQEGQSVCQQLSQVIRHEQLVISVMTGIRLEKLVSWLSHNKVVRSMPNLPVSILKGMTVFFADHHISENECRSVQELFRATGACLQVGDEELLDSATALSGSGPGFVFFLLEQLEKTAKELGFSSEESRLLVTQTLIGSVELWNSSGQSAAELREGVTSKNGTTEAGLRVFQEAGLQQTVHLAFERAVLRARELAQ